MLCFKICIPPHQQMEKIMMWWHWPRPTTNIKGTMSSNYPSPQKGKPWVSTYWIGLYWLKHLFFSYNLGPFPTWGSVYLLWHGVLWRDWKGWEGHIGNISLLSTPDLFNVFRSVTHSLCQLLLSCQIKLKFAHNFWTMLKLFFFSRQAKPS